MEFMNVILINFELSDYYEFLLTHQGLITTQYFRRIILTFSQDEQFLIGLKRLKKRSECSMIFVLFVLTSSKDLIYSWTSRKVNTSNRNFKFEQSAFMSNDTDFKFFFIILIFIMASRSGKFFQFRLLVLTHYFSKITKNLFR